MDFYQIKTKSVKNGVIEIYPDFQVVRSKDIMIRGNRFYAVWDEEAGLWSTDEYDVRRIVDRDLDAYFQDMKAKSIDRVEVKWMRDFNSGSWTQFKKFATQVQDNVHALDEKVIFRSTETKKTDYASKRLPYDLEKGDCPNYERLISTLYDEDERRKIEWGIGAVLSGDARRIQKFIVFYGEAGTGKSTMLEIVDKIFDGYTATFDAKSLGAGSGNQFATEVFRTNPLVAIQHDGDLSRIEDNTRINSIVAHESIIINEKYKSGYPMKLNAMLFMGTNKPVKITDSKSGIIRRLIDVHPSGNRFPPSEYHQLMEGVSFEIGAIAQHCLDVYFEMGRNYYNAYKPFEMIERTDVFYNFMNDNYDTFEAQDGIALSQAWTIYKAYCEETALEYKLPQYKFKEELKNYFETYHDRYRNGDFRCRSYYSGFLTKKFQQGELGETKSDTPLPDLIMNTDKSIFDELCAEFPAQYAVERDGQMVPKYSWDKVRTKLKDLDTTKEHFVYFPEGSKNHIVIDFDLKNKAGEKDADLNLRAASLWPNTYCEFSKSGQGLHLHYIYDGDVNELSRIHSPGIEIKVFTGKATLRRRLSKCNRLPVFHISNGLPLKGAKKKMLNFEGVKSEKKLRELIQRHLKKEIMGYTKPSIDMIYKLLEESYQSGLSYDVSDLSPKVLALANNSSNNAKYCIKLVGKMRFQSEDAMSVLVDRKPTDDRMVFYDVEVFPNLLLIVWKYAGETEVVKMFNPKPEEIEPLLHMKLVGFNCRRYDNHILYARYIGKSIEEIYHLSQKIIGDNGRNALFREAYNISYTDVYDMASAANKMNLKKWEIKLRIHHLENSYPWDKPLSEEAFDEVATYCENDVRATEAVFNHLKGDWNARQILATLAKKSVNDTTNQLTTSIIWGDCKNTKSHLHYRDLGKPVTEIDTDMYNFLKKRFPKMVNFSEESTLPYFPGYVYANGVSLYKGYEVGEGGLVIHKPGIWWNVGLLDIASMHPTSMLCEYLFGIYTEQLWDLVQSRLYIKHKDYEKLNFMFDGKLMQFLEGIDSGEYTFKDLANALKTAINSLYGLTSASFDNAFHDPRNKDNLVAKRGALFMIDLKEAVEAKGWTVVHIKTDSIKIPDITQEKIDFVKEFGERYGYTFEHEDTYQRMCIVNKSTYICVTGDGNWSATASQFAHPYVFKTLFSKEDVVFEDLCETKSTKTALYLDMNEDLGEEHDYRFVGKVGAFCPISEGCGGGELMRKTDEDKYYAVTGTKGYRWLESEMVRSLGKEKDIDMSYFNQLATEAIETIEQYGNYENFVAGIRDITHEFMNEPLPFD